MANKTKPCNCIKEKTITLTNGRQVCSYCPEWMLECEAKELLRKPLDRRRQSLNRRIEKGRNIDELKSRIKFIHETRKRTRGR